MKRDTERRISVEDLLRLKKAERPPPEFWATFEAEIRAKQLSAIVSKRPWWDGVSRALGAFSRYQLPVGAAAAFALAWVGVRYAGNHSEVATTPKAADVEQVAAAVAAPPPASALERTARVPEETGILTHEVVVTQAPIVAASESHITKAPVTVGADSASRSPFTDGIAINLAEFRETTPDYPQHATFSSDREFEPAAAAAREPQSDPLAGMDPAAERRARLLAPALPAYASGGSRALASDWMKARASSNERMYESMDQGSNDRMLVGFRF
jgi:hypothetical protein